MEKNAIAVTFRKMTGEEFRAFKERSIADYAADLTDGQGVTHEAALKEAEGSFNQFLENGPDSPGQFVMTVEDAETGTPVGWMWYAYEDGADGKQVFLADFRIHEAYRRRGYASAALAEMERRAKADGAAYAALCVWDRNPAGAALYVKCGYATEERGDGCAFMKKQI